MSASSGGDLLEITRDGRLLRIALNRPEKRNALNLALCRELVSTLDHGDADHSVGAILITGNGPTFCAGMDLSEAGSTADMAAINRVHEQLFTAGARLTKPVVAAVHGAALAGGTGLVANCHIAMASEEATFGLTEIRIGLWPFVIFRSVAVAVGERRAVELSLTGRIFGAHEAQQLGLVHYVVPLGELHARAGQIAASLAASSPTALRSGLMFVRQIRERGWQESGEIARNIREQVLRSPDFQEGLRAFFEKRAPKWPSLEH